jgi:hypothetical protein
MSKTVEEALATAEAADYRIDALLGASVGPDAGQAEEAEAESQALEPEAQETENVESQETAIEVAAPAAAGPVEPA